MNSDLCGHQLVKEGAEEVVQDCLLVTCDNDLLIKRFEALGDVGLLHRIWQDNLELLHRVCRQICLFHPFRCGIEMIEKLARK